MRPKSAGVDLIDLDAKVSALGKSVFTGVLRLRPHPAGLKVEGRLQGIQVHIEQTNPSPLFAVAAAEQPHESGR